MYVKRLQGAWPLVNTVILVAITITTSTTPIIKLEEKKFLQH